MFPVSSNMDYYSASMEPRFSGRVTAIGWAVILFIIASVVMGAATREDSPPSTAAFFRIAAITALVRSLTAEEALLPIRSQNSWYMKIQSAWMTRWARRGNATTPQDTYLRTCPRHGLVITI